MADEESNDFGGKRPSTWTHQVRTDVELKPAWRMKNPGFERDAIAFWEANHLILPGEEIKERLSQIVAVGYDQGKLIAVATAFIAHVDFVNCKLAMFRCAVAPEQRRSRLSTVITAYSREILEKWSAEHPDEDVRGMGSVTQAREFEGREARLFLRSTHLGFVGWTAQGHPFRIAWFEHAKVPEVPGKTPRTAMFVNAGRLPPSDS